MPERSRERSAGLCRSAFVANALGEYPQLLPEWLQAVAVAQRRVPEEALPDLLDFGQARRELHEAISGVLGQRGRWLARLNPDWECALGGWDERSGKPACAMLA